MSTHDIFNLAKKSALENDSESRKLINKIALERGVKLSSTAKLYDSLSKKPTTFTVPAFNIRFATFNTARAIIRAAMTNQVGAFIFEIARSEIGYTAQRPSEFATSCTAAAIQENFKGALFIQGDHFQFNLKNFKQDANKEKDSIEKLIKEAIDAGFRNIDIDASTLVDLSKPTVAEQQKDNIFCTAQMVKLIRQLEGSSEISIGGEIGEVGGKNSTVEEFEAYAQGLAKELNGIHGISKVSIQTGTTHGGIPMPDGTVQMVNIDFAAHEDISKCAKKYCLGGTVQHGASTLPEELFPKFPSSGCVEIHLATELQNITFGLIPEDLKNRVHNWIQNNLKDEFKKEQTLEQNLYKTRKKSAGPFKKDFWNLPENHPIFSAIEKKAERLFKHLNVINTKNLVSNLE